MITDYIQLSLESERELLTTVLRLAALVDSGFCEDGCRSLYRCRRRAGTDDRTSQTALVCGHPSTARWIGFPFSFIAWN